MDHSRKKQVIFHVEADDYFATLATILTLAHDAFMNAPSRPTSAKMGLKVLGELTDELSFLQKNYRIVERGPIE